MIFELFEKVSDFIHASFLNKAIILRNIMKSRVYLTKLFAFKETGRFSISRSVDTVDSGNSKLGFVTNFVY